MLRFAVNRGVGCQRCGQRVHTGLTKKSIPGTFFTQNRGFAKGVPPGGNDETNYKNQEFEWNDLTEEEEVVGVDDEFDPVGLGYDDSGWQVVSDGEKFHTSSNMAYARHDENDEARQAGESKVDPPLKKGQPGEAVEENKEKEEEVDEDFVDMVLRPKSNEPVSDEGSELAMEDIDNLRLRERTMTMGIVEDADEQVFHLPEETEEKWSKYVDIVTSGHRDPSDLVADKDWLAVLQEDAIEKDKERETRGMDVTVTPRVRIPQSNMDASSVARVLHLYRLHEIDLYMHELEISQKKDKDRAYRDLKKFRDPNELDEDWKQDVYNESVALLMNQNRWSFGEKEEYLGYMHRVLKMDETPEALGPKPGEMKVTDWIPLPEWK